MITFGAKYLSPTIIGKKVGKNEIIRHEAALTEFNPGSKKDIISLGLLASFSLRNTGLTNSIHDDFIMSDSNILYNNKKVRYIVMTQKQDNYDFVRPRNILGLAEISSHHLHPNAIFLEYLQAVKWPLFNKYHYIGTELLNFIKKSYPSTNIELNAIPASVKFYLNNGFEPQLEDPKNNGLRRMIYHSQN